MIAQSKNILTEHKTPSTASERSNPTDQAFVTLQPHWIPFNSLGAVVANKRQYKTGKVPHLSFSLTKPQ